MAITLRSVKASALTHNELDANFTTLVAADVVLTDAVALNTARTQVVEAASTASTVAGGQWVSDGAGGGEFIRIQGWSQHTDTRTTVTTPTQNIATGVRTKWLNDGVSTTIRKQPSDATAHLWDVATSKFAPIAVFDTYNIRLTFKVQNYAGTTPDIKVELDIGGSLGVISAQTIPLLKGGAEQDIMMTFPVFAGSTMLTNGGTFYITFTGTGTCDVYDNSIFIVRESKNYV
jgi:hypothetical protein